MSRGGKAKLADGPERRCIVTGETGPKPGLIRFVADPEGRIVPDVLERLPGRGIWVSADRGAIETAVKKSLFARGAKAQVSVPEDLADTVEDLLCRRVTDLIALARKAGGAVAGFEKVKDWLSQEGRVKVLLQASDGSARGKSKLWTPTGARFFGCLTASELGLAFGRQSVIHGALQAGGLATRVVEEAAKLQGLRQADGGTSASGKDRRNA
ncbi:RNA-binding protein [Rhodobacterales bacterium HKCCE2091]|nr:RNA-binding protein [Rhodobacterales bacterium HKCCE2091]